MIVVADSGSTKTEWRLCSAHGVVAAVHTGGLNPLALGKASVISALKSSEINDWLGKDITEVYFYGAGVVDALQQEVVRNNLKLLFKEATILVNSDLLGAARSVFGDNEGLIGILGTGSNSGYYDGHDIKKRIPALGYMLADEGSGSALGRLLIKHFLRDELPYELSLAFKDYYPEHETLIETVYAQKHAARFLASFVPFIVEHKEVEFIHDLLSGELRNYVNLLRKYQGNYKIGIVGSIGFQFRQEINYLAKAAGLNILDYIKNPIDNLANYHQSKIL